MRNEAPERDPRAMRRAVSRSVGLRLSGVDSSAVGGAEAQWSAGESEARAEPAWRPPNWAVGSAEERQALPQMPTGTAPDALPEWLPEHQEEIQRLFEAALRAELPRERELRSWEPAKLHPRHLQMILMRAEGFHQRTIAKAFGTKDAHVSIVMNHPDGEYLLSRLSAMHAMRQGGIRQRLEELAGPAVDALEAAFLEDDPEVTKVAMKKAPLAFKVLEFGGFGAPKTVPGAPEGGQKHLHLHLEATGSQLSELKRAMVEARALRAPEVEEIQEVEVLEERLSASQGGGDEEPGS